MCFHSSLKIFFSLRFYNVDDDIVYDEHLLDSLTHFFNQQSLKLHYLIEQTLIEKRLCSNHLCNLMA